MDIFLILQILFDFVLLFGVLFLFHFSVNQQQKKKEEFDIVKNIQVQETKENLEKLLLTMKQLGKDVSDDIQKKISESEEKTEVFKQNIKKMEAQLSMTVELIEEVGAERGRLENKIKLIRSTTNGKEKLPSDDKITDKSVSRVERKKRVSKPQNGYSVGFSSGIIKQVYKMVDNDLDINEILKATKLSKAEIQLILNLRENRFTAPN
jgi:preprotein translocase subunit YajC